MKKTIEHITVGQYQELYKIQKSDLHEIDKLTNTVAVLCGKTNDEIEAMPTSELNSLIVEAENLLQRTELPGKPKRHITITGKSYAIIYNPRRLKAWQSFKINSLMKGDRVENLHQILAAIVTPVKDLILFKVDQPLSEKDHAQLAETMRQADFNDINAACSYFIKLWNVSIQALKPMISKELATQSNYPIDKEYAEALARVAVTQAMIK